MSLINRDEFNRLLTEANGDPKKYTELYVQVVSSFEGCFKQLRDLVPDNAFQSDLGLEEVQGAITQLLKYLDSGDLDNNSIPALPPRSDVPGVPDVIAPVTGIALADAFASLEKHGERVTWILMNPAEYADLRKFGRDLIDVETRAPWCKAGVMGVVWGAKVVVNRSVPEGTVYMVNDLDQSFMASKFIVQR